MGDVARRRGRPTVRAGLPTPSLVKPVLTTLEPSLIIRTLGSLGDTGRTDVRATLPQILGFRLRRHLEALLGRPVDLVTRDALKPQLREQIVREAVPAAQPASRSSG